MPFLSCNFHAILDIVFLSSTLQASDGEPMARVPEVALIALSAGTRIIAPVQSSFPERSSYSQDRDSHLKRHY